MADPVIFFDGVCNLCNASVKFVVHRDKHARYKYASLQSDYAKSVLQKLNKDPEKLDSIVLYEEDKVFEKSTAALRIAKNLTGLWPLLYVFIIVPKSIRDVVYDFIARNRYRWFGKKETCEIPTPEQKERFIDI